MGWDVLSTELRLSNQWPCPHRSGHDRMGVWSEADEQEPQLSQEGLWARGQNHDLWSHLGALLDMAEQSQVQVK